MMPSHSSAARVAEPQLHPALAAAMVARNRAPGEPDPPELRAELERITADLEAGREELVDHDDMPAWLEAMARREHDE